MKTLNHTKLGSFIITLYPVLFLLSLTGLFKGKFQIIIHLGMTFSEVSKNIYFTGYNWLISFQKLEPYLGHPTTAIFPSPNSHYPNPVLVSSSHY